MFIQNKVLFFTCAALAAVSLAHAAAQWPDSFIKAPVDFKAFYCKYTSMHSDGHPHN